MVWEELLQLTDASIDAMDMKDEYKILFRALLTWYKKLYAQVNWNGSNTNQSSSQQVYHKPQSTRQQTGKSPWWQVGHIGRTLTQKECVDTRIYVKDAWLWGMKKMQIIDITPPWTEYTEYLITWVSDIPDGSIIIEQKDLPKYITWPVQYWPHLRAFVLYLRNHAMMTYGKIADVLKEFWSLSISEWTLEWFDRAFAKQLSPWYTTLKTEVIKQDLLHADETGIRVWGKNWWVHSFSNTLISLFAFHEKRWWKATEEIGILAKYKGILVHDFWSNYFFYTQYTHAMCGAHLLRELQRIIDYETEWKERAIQMHSLLLDLKKSIENKDTDSVLRHKLLYDGICASGQESYPPTISSWKRWRAKQLKGKNLLDRFTNYQADILRFSTDKNIPFTNNQAERDLRMNKVKMKVSGCFRSATNAQYFAIIRSFFETTKKQGTDLVSAIFWQLTYAVS